jgi:fatty acid desaturase
MSNMTENQRAQYERVELKVPSTGVQLRSKRGLVIYMALAVPILAALAYAAVAGIDHWWQGVVLGMIVFTTVGMMIAISPNRRA